MATGAFHVLFESASGYALFSVIEAEEVGSLLDEVQQSVTDLSRFQRTVKLVAFQPFTSAENALENINAVSEHALTDDLKNFLELKLGKSKKKKNVELGVAAPPLGTAIQETLGISCKSDEVTREVVRGIRMHFNRFIKELDNGMLEKAQLGLGHSYSRAKVKFNPGRADNMIIQAIALLDQLDKDINTFAMRVREWYCWHFPELRELVKDNYMFARCAAFIRDRSELNEEKLPGLTEIVGDDNLSTAILNAARHSMGMDTTPLDMANIVQFTKNMVQLADYRRQVYNYLVDKMSTVAPNLSTLIGETVAARLIQKAGSLTSLAKCPASTVQILGAEKALFRALKTRGNTPKYGLIYHSTFIGRASTKNKGRISRYLANKCAIASRIDSFIEEPTNKYGEELREQVEERLNFYDTGEAPRKNVDVMHKVAQQLRTDEEVVVKKRKKTAAADDDEEETKAETSGDQEKKKKKKKKQQEAEEESSQSEQEEAPKKKKKKKSLGAAAEEAPAAEDAPKKKKKKNRD